MTSTRRGASRDELRASEQRRVVVGGRLTGTMWLCYRRPSNGALVLPLRAEAEHARIAAECSDARASVAVMPTIGVAPAPIVPGRANPPRSRELPPGMRRAGRPRSRLADLAVLIASPASPGVERRQRRFRSETAPRKVRRRTRGFPPDVEDVDGVAASREAGACRSPVRDRSGASHSCRSTITKGR